MKFSEVSAWIEQNETLLAWLGAGSLVTFFASLVAAPLIVIAMPADFFARSETPLRDLSPLRIFARLMKNVFGVLLIIAGLAMLFLPGQGLLTLLVGFGMVNLPGKRQAELKLIRLRGVRTTIAGIRRKANKEPLRLP